MCSKTKQEFRNIKGNITMVQEKEYENLNAF